MEYLGDVSAVQEVWREAWNGSGPLSLRGGKRKRAGEDSWRRTSCVFPGSSLVFEQPRRRLWMLVRCLRSKGRHRFCHLATEWPWTGHLTSQSLSFLIRKVDHHKAEETVWLGELKLEVCDNLKGWDGMGSGREGQEGGDMCVPLADSCWCMAETNTTL